MKNYDREGSSDSGYEVEGRYRDPFGEIEVSDIELEDGRREMKIGLLFDEECTEVGF